MNKEIKILCLIVFGLSQATLAQSPWTKEKGKAYVQLGFSGIFFNKAKIDGKTVDLKSDYSDVTLQLYNEYGITDKLEAQLVIPYKSVVRTDIGGITQNFSGIGNINLGLKYKIFDKNLKISTGLQYWAKTSRYDATSNLSTDFDASTMLPYLTIGSSSGKWYYYGNIGYGYMSNDFSDYFRFNAELGYQIIPQGHIILALETRNIVSSEDAYTTNQKQWISYLDRQTYNAFGIKLNYEFTKDKFGVNFAGYGAFGNNNVSLAPSLNLGVYAKL
jgi:hypothetical protein